MNCLAGIRTNNDLATLKGATVSYSNKSKQLLHNGKPLDSWVFTNRREAEGFAIRHGAFVKPC